MVGEEDALDNGWRHSANTWVINGRVAYKHPFIELVAKFVGGILALSTGLSLGREGPSVQIGSYVGFLVSKWGECLLVNENSYWPQVPVRD